MSTCRNGHPLSKVGMVWTGDHYQCRACRLKTQQEANVRYFGTAKGMLTHSRNDANRRGNR